MNPGLLATAGGVAGTIAGIIVLWQLNTTFVEEAIEKSKNSYDVEIRAYIDKQDISAVTATVELLKKENLAIAKDVEINSDKIARTSQQSYQSVTRLLNARRYVLSELKNKLDNDIRPELEEERAWVSNEINAIDEILEEVNRRWPQ